MFRFSLKGPRAHIFFAKDDSSQSRNVLNYVIITNYLIFFNWTVEISLIMDCQISL